MQGRALDAKAPVRKADEAASRRGAALRGRQRARKRRESMAAPVVSSVGAAMRAVVRISVRVESGTRRATVWRVA